MMPSEEEESLPFEGSQDEGPAGAVEICGWYMYDFANSPYYQVYLGPVLPLLLKWLAQEYAWSGYVEEHGGDGDLIPPPWPKKENLLIPGTHWTAGSYPLVINVITCLFQVICFLSFSPLADFGGYRKMMLVVTTWLGAGTTALNILCLDSSLFWLAGVLRVTSGIFFGLSLVFYNAYLPAIGAAHPDVLELEGRQKKERYTEILDELSGKGMQVGYAGGALLSVICYLIMLNFECKEDVGDGCTEWSKFFWPCFCVVLVSLWWALFSEISFWTLKRRPGPPFPEGENVLCFGWKQTWDTLCLIVAYRHLLYFIIAYFIYSDAYNTIITVAPLILESETGASLSSTMMYAFLLPIVMILGIFLYSKVQQFFGISSKNMILGQLCLYAASSLVGGAGMISSFGMLGLCVVYVPAMITLGSIQSYSRSLYAELLPKGKEAALFAFYEITDKGSNFIGTGVTALIHNKTHSYEGAFWYVLPAMLVAAVFVSLIDQEEGAAEAARLVAPRRSKAAE